MRKNLKSLFVGVGLYFAAMISPVWADDIHIAVAANFHGTLQTLAAQYEAEHQTKLVISAGASGGITTQITNGAPFDIFLSADVSRPQQLIEQGYAFEDSFFVYAYGVPVLWRASGEGRFDGEAYLTSGDYRYLAIADPRTAPYGLAAQQILTHLGLFETLEKQRKIVRGSSIGQTYSQIASGAADAGFVALAQVQTESGIPGSYWIPPTETYAPIAQGAVLLKNAKNIEQARAFLQWLKTDPAVRAQVENAGYSLESLD